MGAHAPTMTRAVIRARAKMATRDLIVKLVNFEKKTETKKILIYLKSFLILKIELPCDLVSDKCQNGATCNNDYQGGSTCTCDNGYTGESCETREFKKRIKKRIRIL